MNNFGGYLTPEEAVDKTQLTLAEAKALAARPLKTCLNCDEKEWKLGQCGLCFSCTTGEADASDDYEIETIP